MKLLITEIFVVAGCHQSILLLAMFTVMGKSVQYAQQKQEVHIDKLLIFNEVTYCRSRRSGRNKTANY